MRKQTTITTENDKTKIKEVNLIISYTNVSETAQNFMENRVKLNHV